MTASRRDPCTVGLTGEVVCAGDSTHEEARLGWNRLYSRYPDTTVFCANAQDVITSAAEASATVTFAAEHLHIDLLPLHRRQEPFRPPPSLVPRPASPSMVRTPRLVNDPTR